MKDREARKKELEETLIIIDYYRKGENRISQSNRNDIYQLQISRDNHIDHRKGIKYWDVGDLYDMSNMFNSLDFNLDISRWNVSRVTDMNCMFCNCYKFYQDINCWDVRNVTNMSFMFACTGFNQYIGDWHVNENLSVNQMFKENKNFKPEMLKGKGWKNITPEQLISMGIDK